MTDTKEINETKLKSPEKKDISSVKKGEKKGRIRPRNYDLGNGVYRFSRTRMFHKKAIYKFLSKKTPKSVCCYYIIFYSFCILYTLLNILINYNINIRLNLRSQLLLKKKLVVTKMEKNVLYY